MSPVPRYMYTFVELFSYMGDGTPQNPGGDFMMCVLIDADDVGQARWWGKRVLEEFVRERFSQSDPDVDPSRYEGEVAEVAEMLQLGTNDDIPVCKVGEIPRWTEPWKHCRASGAPRRLSTEGRNG